MRVLVRGLDHDLTDDLAVSQLDRRGGQYPCPVRVFARPVERRSPFPEDLTLVAVGHVPVFGLTPLLQKRKDVSIQEIGVLRQAVQQGNYFAKGQIGSEIRKPLQAARLRPYSR